MARVAAIAALVGALGAAPPAAQAAHRFQARDGAVDLVLIGYLVFQTNLSDRVDTFFDNADQLPPEMNDRQVLNLRLEGKLGDSTRLDARLLHDRENLRDWRYLLRMGGERNLMAVGELDGALRETEFLRYDTPFYGFEGRLGLGAVTTSAFGTTRSGNYRVDRLRGANLSGPYYLTASPVLEASERVVIEVHDRREEARILRTELKLRGQDYAVDYSTGAVVFNTPIEAETFDGDPVFILVEYQRREDEGSSTEYLSGARFQVEPWKGLKVASSFMRSTGEGDGALRQGGLVGADLSLSPGRWLQLDGELAGPQGNPLAGDEGALRLAAAVRPTAALTVNGRYRRVGQDFDVAANPQIEAERGREEWQVDTTFLAGKAHELNAGYGVRSDRGVAGESGGSRVRTLFAGWTSRLQGWPVLGVDFERRLSDSQDSASTIAPSTIDTLTVDGEDGLGRWWLLGPTKLRAQYRFEHSFDDDPAGEDRRSHTVRLRLESQPREGIDTFVELLAARDRDQGPAGTASRTRELLAGGRLRLGRGLTGGASLRLRGTAQDSLGGDSEQTTALFDLRYDPSERLGLSLRYEWNLSESGSTGDLRRNLFAQVRAVPVAGLTLAAGRRLDDRGGDSEGQSGGHGGGEDGEYFVSALYKPNQRLTLFARGEKSRSEERLPPYEPTESDRDTYVLGASFDLTSHWRLLGQFKDERLSGASDAWRRALGIELTRSLGKMIRIGLGTELSLDQQGDQGELDRQRVYLKLIGVI